MYTFGGCACISVHEMTNDGFRKTPGWFEGVFTSWWMDIPVDQALLRNRWSIIVCIAPANAEKNIYLWPQSMALSEDDFADNQNERQRTESHWVYRKWLKFIKQSNNIYIISNNIQ